MSFFSKMNAKLDEGYKMTNINCETCKFSLLINPPTKFLYCPKCDYETKEPAQILVEKDEKLNNENTSEELEIKGEQDLDEELKNMFSKPSKSDDQSKKLSQKLLQGWAMLEEVCPDCMIPIMRSKQGVKLCVGCDNAYQRPLKQNIPSQIIQQTQNDQQKLSVQTQNQQTQQQLMNDQNLNQLMNTKLHLALEKMLKFYDSKLDVAVLENDVQKVGFLSDKIFEILSNFKSLNK